jgi:hypothetical protein
MIPHSQHSPTSQLSTLNHPHPTPTNEPQTWTNHNQQVPLGVLLAAAAGADRHRPDHPPESDAVRRSGRRGGR